MPTPRNAARAEAVKSIIGILEKLKRHREWDGTVLAGLITACFTLCTSSMILMPAMYSGAVGIGRGASLALLSAAVSLLLTLLFHRRIYLSRRRKALLRDLRRAIDACSPPAITLEAARATDPSLLAWAETVFDIAQVLQDYGPFDPDRVIC